MPKDSVLKNESSVLNAEVLGLIAGYFGVLDEMFSRTFPKTPLVVIIRTENDQKSRRQESRLKEETFVSRLHQQNHLSVVLAGGVLAILKRPI